MQKEHSEDNATIMLARAEVMSDALDRQAAMLDATPDCIKVLSPDGVLLAMSRSGCHALGIAPADVNGTSWIPLLPPSIHEAACEALALAVTGISARFAGHSEASGNVIFWDNLLTPVVDRQGSIQSIVCVSRDVTEKTLLKNQLEESLAREQLLSFEMQHRIKNVFTVVNALVMIAEKEARATGDPGQLAQIVTGKLGALARASDAVLTRSGLESLDIEVLAGSVLRPFGSQCRMSGPPQPLDVDVSNTLALSLHELATNSVKHGALSASDGGVDIDWKANEQWLEINWRETGGPVISNPPGRLGFGTRLIDRVVASAGGAVVRNWFPGGLQVELKVPLRR